MRRHGFVFVFPAGIDRETANTFASEFAMRVEMDACETAEQRGQVHLRLESYDDEMGGGPVWYIP